MGKQLELFPEDDLPYWDNNHVPFVSEVETFNKTMGKINNYTPNIPEISDWRYKLVICQKHVILKKMLLIQQHLDLKNKIKNVIMKK